MRSCEPDFEDRFKDLSLLSSLQLGETTRTRWTSRIQNRTRLNGPVLSGRTKTIHTIFEGTSEIQQLVISRAISGLRIE
jgi:hypothetical protein